MAQLRSLKLVHRSPLSLVIVGFLLLFVVLAVSFLAILGRATHAQVRTAATDRILAEGSELTRFLGGMPIWDETNGVALAWMRLPFLVDGLHRAKSGLQYIEVSRDGVKLFHRQVGDPVPAGALISAPATLLSNQIAESSPVTVAREVLDLFGESVPVLVFRQLIDHANGCQIQVEIGMRQDSIAVREADSTRAVRWMLRLAVLILLLASLFYIAVTVIAVHRDRRMEQRQRREEHLLFSGMVANSIVHDFRNPMSAVRLDAQMLEREARRPEGPRPERLGELAGRIARTLNRMDGVFREFLFMSRPAQAVNERFDLCQCLRDCVETLAARVEQARLRVVLDLPESPAHAGISEPALRRAIVNVLQNAIQHAPAESAIEIRLAADREHPRLWRIEIGDRGPGIPPAMREAVFEMFVTTRPEGTGLGLFMARAAIDNFGGTITAHGRDGGGTLIRITIPAAAETGTSHRETAKGNKPCP